MIVNSKELLKQELLDRYKKGEINMKLDVFMDELWICFECSNRKSRTLIRPEDVLEMGLDGIILSAYRGLK